MRYQTKQSRITKLAQAINQRKKELRLINRDNHPDDHSANHLDIQPPSAGMIWDGRDYLTASDRNKD